MAGEPVLGVDDSPPNQKLLTILLAGEEYDVRVAGNTEEALAVELTRQLRTATHPREVLILGLTACAMPDDAERVLAAGCDGYLTKPIDVHDFLATVAGHLRP